MTIWCNSCKCHVSSPCTFHHLPQDQLRSLCRRFRSTKGASKARRDHINHEIRNMRALLPISQEEQERLSYLHSMAAICTYIRKSVLLQGLPGGQRSHCSLPYEAFLEALHGFILVTTATGKLVYVSENVAEYTGVSMVDVLQGDTLYDMVERADVDVVQSNLESENNLSPDRSFVCCMQSSKAFKMQHGSCCSMLVRGSFQFFPRPSPAASPPGELLFVALCTPTVNRLTDSDSHFCHSFSSTHRLDMSFTRLSDSVLYFLGYSADEMTGRSWYSFVHPEDLTLCADSHRSLMMADKGSQVEMVLRLQCMDLSWTWIYVRAHKDSECQSIICTNFIISETEATFLQKKISSDAFKPSAVPDPHHCPQQEPPGQSHGGAYAKRQRTWSSQSEEPAARRRRVSEQDVYCALCTSTQGSSCDSPVLFTPPYSPASSSSLLDPGELSHDLLMAANDCTDQLPSSPESSPSYYSYPEAALTCHRSPAGSLPAAAEQSLDHGDLLALSTLSPLSSSSSPSYDFQASHAQLVPDCLSVSDMCESPVDSASLHPDEFDLLEQPQGGGFVQLHHVPHQEFPLHPGLLPPNQSSSSEPSQYNEREQAEISILAQQISSLASSFNMQHTMSVFPPAAPDSLPPACDWPHSAPLPKRQPVHNTSLLDSFLKDHNTATRRSSSSDVVPCSYQQDLISSRSGSIQSEHGPLGLIAEDSLPAEQFTKDGMAEERFGLQLGLHEHNPELHQLLHYLQSVLHKS
ncbi:neuronal PAS domain-containing protein 4-like [Cololabis saira]|uniref:neuronal PAS domain-containing protein 4-like n=1 Tax=Cololabis saira TaxID=129043 RepID=UPI002AD5169B|nr:neuronal PAS domain-containing protein 4-like [Cololabis saira]